MHSQVLNVCPADYRPCILALGASQVVLVIKNMPANAGDIRDAGSIPGLGRSPGGGNVFSPKNMHKNSHDNTISQKQSESP